MTKRNMIYKRIINARRNIVANASAKMRGVQIIFILHGSPLPGYGDYMYILKVADILRNYYGTRRANVIIHSEGAHYAKLSKIATKSAIDAVRSKSQISDIVKQNPTHLKIFMNIATPDVVSTFEDVMDTMSYRINIDEYNGWRIATNMSAYEASRSKNLISGIGVDGVYETSGITCNVIKSENDNAYMTIADKFQKGTYYFGYISEGDISQLVNFLGAVIEARHDTEQLEFLIVNGTVNSFIEMLMTSYDVNHLVIKKDLRYSITIKHISAQGESNPTTLIIKNADNPFVKQNVKLNVTVYVTKFLHPIEFNYLLKNSKDVVLLTGDQSFSEGIIYDKLIFYQCQPWKRSLFSQYVTFVRFLLGKQSLLHNFLEQQLADEKKENNYYVYDNAIYQRLIPNFTAYGETQNASSLMSTPRIYMRDILNDPSIMNCVRYVHNAIRKYYDIKNSIVKEVDGIIKEYLDKN